MRKYVVFNCQIGVKDGVVWCVALFVVSADVCMDAFVHVCLLTHTHTHAHAHTHMHTHTCTHAHTCTHTHTRMKSERPNSLKNGKYIIQIPNV